MAWTKVGSGLNWKAVATSAGMLPVGPEPLWLVGEDGELMARVQVQGTSGYVANVTPEGKLSVDAQVTATVADSNIKGSPDNGVSWLPVKVDSSGQLLVAIPAGVTLSGSKTRISSAPVTGVKTVTSVAAEIFAGASRKAGRSRLVIRNMHPFLRIRVGPSSVTDTTGFGIEPLALLEIDIDPASDVPWYAVSEAGNVPVEVLEA